MSARLDGEGTHDALSVGALPWRLGMGGRRRSQIVTLAAVGLAALGGGACGSGTLVPVSGHGGAGAGHGGGASGHGGAGARDGGGAGQGVGGAGDGSATELDGGADAALCPSVGALTAEPAPRQVALDGGLPIEQLPYALAVARCDYQRRCFAVSTYVFNECVDSVASTGRWGYQVCGDQGLEGSCPSEGEDFLLPTALQQAVESGVVRYDAQREAQCIAALLAEGCAGDQLIETILPCTGILGCPPPVDGGAAPTTDGGATCSQFVPPEEQFWRSCVTDDDCAGETSPQGPDCVGGICAPTRCGITIGGCTTFAAAGEPCASSALSLVNNIVTPDGMCAPGLACQGVPADGGLGTCVVPADVGGSCSDNTGCKPGLACACGTCEIPPSTGPCVNGLCEVGVAYCDFRSHTCLPVRAEGASCVGAFDACAPGLLCNGSVCAWPG